MSTEKKERSKGLARLKLRAARAAKDVGAVCKSLVKHGKMTKDEGAILSGSIEELETTIQGLIDSGDSLPVAGAGPTVAEGDSVVLTNKGNDELMELYGLDEAPRGLKVVKVVKGPQKNSPRKVTLTDAEGRTLVANMSQVRPAAK